MSALWALVATTAAACPATPEALDAQVGQAESAFAAIDTVAFKRAVIVLDSSLGCLTGAPDPRLSSRVHEVGALDAFFDQDQGRALLSLRAMLESWPDADLSPELAPPGGELRAWLAMARHMPSTLRAPVALPPGQTLWVDGSPADEVPADRPALIVILGSDGAPVWSGVGTGTAGLPLTRAPSDPATTAQTENIQPQTTLPSPPGPRRLLLGAGGMAVASAGLWVGALISSHQVEQAGAAIADGEDPELEDGADLDALVLRTNALGFAGQVTTGLALGLGVVGLVVRW